ncbi:MAG: Hsp20/alpha crystallin family protein [Pseudomonadota bacterium]
MLKDLIPSVRRTPARPLEADPIVSFRNSLERLFEDFSTNFEDLTPTPSGQFLRSFTPKLDLQEDDSKIILTAELPGLRDNDVQVELNRDYLTIKGEKKSFQEDKNKDGIHCERTFGAFERTIRLTSEINKDKIDASVRDGVLTVNLPKTHEGKKDVKRIPVHH